MFLNPANSAMDRKWLNLKKNLKSPLGVRRLCPPPGALREGPGGWGTIWLDY